MDAPPVQYVSTSDGYDIAYTVSGAGPPLDPPRHDWEGYLEVMTRSTTDSRDAVLEKNRTRESTSQADYLMLTDAMAKSSLQNVATSLAVPTLLLAANSETWNFGAEAGARQLAALIPDSRIVLSDHMTAGLMRRRARRLPTFRPSKHSC